MDALNAFDLASLEAVVALGRPGGEILDRAVRLFVQLGLLKMGVPVLLLLYVWLRSPDWAARPGVLADPALVMRGVAAILLAIAAGRLMQEGLPARPRPYIALPHFPFPLQGEVGGLDDWSSFPSDHAVMAGAMAMAVGAAAPTLGLVAAAWGLVAISLPRIYFGLHYLSDVLTGFAIGMLLAWLVLRMPLPGAGVRALHALDRRAPVLVLLGLFVLGWEMLEMFETVRRLGMALAKATAVLAGDGAFPGGG